MSHYEFGLIDLVITSLMANYWVASGSGWACDQYQSAAVTRRSIWIYHSCLVSPAVSAISDDPRPIATPMGRQVCGVVGPAVRQLDWGMELVEGDHGLQGQHKEHRLPNHVFIVEYRLVNLMTINVFSLFASMTHCHSGRHDIGIATYRTITTVLYDVGIAT